MAGVKEIVALAAITDAESSLSAVVNRRQSMRLPLTVNRVQHIMEKATSQKAA